MGRRTGTIADKKARRSSGLSLFNLTRPKERVRTGSFLFLVWFSALLISTASATKTAFATDWINPDEARYTSQEHALGAAFSSGKPGPFVWLSRESKGRVTITRNFQHNGYACRNVLVQASPSLQASVYRTVTGCRTANGMWDFVDGDQVPIHFTLPKPTPQPKAGTGTPGAPESAQRPVITPPTQDPLTWLERLPDWLYVPVLLLVTIPAWVYWSLAPVFAFLIFRFWRSRLKKRRQEEADRLAQIKHEKFMAEKEQDERERNELARRQWARLEEALNDV